MTEERRAQLRAAVERLTALFVVHEDEHPAPTAASDGHPESGSAQPGGVSSGEQ